MGLTILGIGGGLLHLLVGRLQLIEPTLKLTGFFVGSIRTIYCSHHEQEAMTKDGGNRSRNAVRALLGTPSRLQQGRQERGRSHERTPSATGQFTGAPR